MAQDPYAAIVALQELLKTITGPPDYWTNLEERVYTKLWTPRDNVVPTNKPFLVMVRLDGNDDDSWNDGGGHLTHAFNIALIFFTPETSASQQDSQAMLDAAKLEADIYKVLLLDSSLSGTVHHFETIPGGRAMTGIPEVPYAEKMMVVKLHQFLTRQSLGPA